MQAVNFEETIDKLVEKDPRYQRNAYFFLREALDHTQKLLGRSGKDEIHHVTGQELLEGVRAYALLQYGPMSITVLNEWGIRQCEDFGEMVFNLVEVAILAKTERDTRDDFKNGYDFIEAFRRPFIPDRPTLHLQPEPRSTQV